jgi:hypothetical protein
MKAGRYSILLAAIIVTVPAIQSRADITFDNAGQLAQFSLNGAASSTFHFSPTAGVGGGGGLTSTATNYGGDFAIFTNGIANTIGASSFVSLDYKMGLQPGPDLRLGFTTSVNGSLAGSNSVWAETYGTTTSKGFAFYANSANFYGFPSVPMILGDWTRLRLDLTKTSATTYNLTATIFDLGTTGLSTPVTLATDNLSFPAAIFGSGSTLFPGFYVSGQTVGADNFNATSVPEPSATALAGLAAVTLLRFRRKAASR